MSIGIIALLALVTSASAAASCAPPENLIRIQAARGELVATIAPELGGELVGLEVKRQRRSLQLLYRGMTWCATEGWAGKAPILWPATGRNFVDDPARTPGRPEASFGWLWQGKRYPMPIHGFARTQQWHVEAGSDASGSDRVTLSLTDTPDTLEMYPFRFRFKIEYRVAGQSLRMRHQITAAASNETAMPFSIGNHITFNHPLVPAHSDQVATVTSSLNQHLTLDKHGRPERMETIPSFERRALSFFGERSAFSLVGDPLRRAWARWDDPSGISITLSHQASRAPRGTPVLFNLWGDLASGYFSIEPWMGKQNSLVTGDGIIELPPGETFEWNLDIRIDGQ